KQWQKRPTTWAEKTTTLATFCVTDHGILWYLVSGGQLRSIALDGPAGEPAAKRASALIAQLDDDDFQVRERAFATLAAMNEEARLELESAQKTASSAETKVRIETLLQRIESNKKKAVSGAPAVVETALGDCRVRMAQSI